MITLLTPSKTMDFVTPVPAHVTSTSPVFSDEAIMIRTMLMTQSAAAISELMHVSAMLAEQVVGMYKNNDAKKPAAWTYTGDVFKGYQASTLTKDAAIFAQEHLLIASGVYGVLRPNDAIQPYRLEMKTKLSIEGARNLYDFWGERLGQYIETLPNLAGELCVLSSEEYAKAALSHLPKKIRIVTPVFIDLRPNGKEGQVPIYNKMMRGVMAHWIMENRIDSVSQLPQFSGHGYNYSVERSAPDRPVYYRQVMTPLRFS